MNFLRKLFYTFVATLLLFFLSLSYADQSTCPKGEYRVRAHFRTGYVRSDGTVVKPTQVKASCKPLSRESEYTKDRFKSTIPLNWPHKAERLGNWTEAEKERIIDALKEIPDALLIDKILGIYRLKKSKDYPNPASSADGILVLYDSSFDNSRNLARILSMN